MRNFSNLNTSSNSASLLEIFLTNVLLHDPVIAFVKVFKILTEVNKVFNLHKFLTYVFPKFNWKFICASCYLYLMIGNLNQNAYSGTFSNINHKFKVKNLETKNFLQYFIIN